MRNFLTENKVGIYPKVARFMEQRKTLEENTLSVIRLWQQSIVDFQALRHRTQEFSNNVVLFDEGYDEYL